MITHIASHSKMTNKRTFSDAMEIEHEENSTTTNKQKVEVEGEMVKVTGTKGKKKHMKVKGTSFEIKDYSFLGTPEDSTTQFKTRA